MAEASKSQTVEGGCLCGAVRYRASGAPRANALCHCKTCRHASGAPSVAWTVFAAEDFAFTAAAPSVHRSSPDVERTFCGRCGTPLTYQRSPHRGTIDVTTISLDHPEQFAPTKEIWITHRVPWEALNPQLQQHRGSSVGASQD